MQKHSTGGILTITFDDAYLDTYKHAIKYLDKLNIKCTVGVPASLVGHKLEKRPVIGLSELKALTKHGHEIASHTLKHTNLLDLSRKDRKASTLEISDSKKVLERMTGCKVKSFIFPYINKNETYLLKNETKIYYTSARTTANSPCFNKVPLKNDYDIKGFAIMKKHSVNYLNKQIDYTVKNNLWLIETFHLVGKKNTQSVSRPKPYRYFMHINDFKKHIDYILSRKIKILTQTAAVKKLTKAPYGIQKSINIKSCR